MRPPTTMVPGSANLTIHIADPDGGVIAHGEFAVTLVAPAEEEEAEEKQAAQPQEEPPTADEPAEDDAITWPEFVCDEPLLACWQMDPEGAFMAWMVVDKSAADGEFYDVLYLDLNGNGDLTDDGERFAVEPTQRGTGALTTFAIPRWEMPGGDIVHTGINVRVYATPTIAGASTGLTRLYLYLRWGGTLPLSGNAIATSSPETAPVFAMHGDYPLDVDMRGIGSVQPGQEASATFYGGHRAGPDQPFVCVTQNLAEGNEFVVTLTGQDEDGNEVVATFELSRFC